MGPHAMDAPILPGFPGVNAATIHKTDGHFGAYKRKGGGRVQNGVVRVLSFSRTLKGLASRRVQLAVRG